MKTAARDRVDKTPRDFLRCPVLAVARAMDEAAHFFVGVARNAEQRYSSEQYHEPTQT
ncbi:MAG TPA: hypothetical protein VFR24_03660 [Candidatus Angelobacter sp.]|nr:hypothetical protein [Candidatus Angelobacter sp.]